MEDVLLGSFAVKNTDGKGLISWRGVDVSEKGHLKLAELTRTDERVAWAGEGTRKWRRADGEVVVVRLLPMTDKKQRDEAMRELETLWEIKAHKNVVSFLGAAYSETDAALAVGLQYTDGGSLSEMLRRGGIKLPELMVARIGRQIVEGLMHLHSRQIIHRRLTPDTVLVTHAGDIKITDFELAKLGSAAAAAPSARRSAGKARPGEATYAAPERLADQTHSANVDIYALGVIAVDLATGTLALDAESGSGDRGRRGPPTLKPTVHSASLCDFVSRCYWSADIRPSSREMLMHPFVQQHTGLSELRLADSSVPPLTKEIVMEFLHHFYQHLTEALVEGSENDLALVMALYSESSIVTVGGSEYTGRDQICAQIRALGNHEYVVEDDQLHLVNLNRRSFFALCLGHDHAGADGDKGAHSGSLGKAFSHSFELKLTPQAELYIARQELRRPGRGWF